ncbi:hypothetical protein BH11ARM2_BH11ARM2_33760 [soil metagenome]
MQTWPQLLDAADLRYEECGAESGRRLPYVAGYVTELLLKSAYFQVSQWSPMKDVEDACKRPLGKNKVTGQYWIPEVDPSSPGYIPPILTSNAHPGHDLVLWLHVLNQARAKANMGSVPFDIDQCVNGLAADWNPEMRYDSVRPSNSRIRSVLRQTRIVYSRRIELWS